MKRLAAVLAGAALMVGTVSAANALTLRASTDGVTWTTVSDNGFKDSDHDAGSIRYTYAGNNGFNYSVRVTGTSDSDAGSAGLSIQSIDTQGSGKVYLQLSDAPYSNVIYRQAGVTSGLTINSLANGATGTFQLNTYASNSSTEFDISPLNLVSALTRTTSGYTFETKPLDPTLVSPFSLTEELIINQTGGRSNITGELDVTSVPEPGTMMLLGTGFLGLAIYGKRRKNA